VEEHYAVTIDHVLQDGTTHATLMSDNVHQTVSIPVPFQRVNLTPSVLNIVEKPGAK
jgi:hypothetical protein